MRKRAVMHWAEGSPSRVLIVKKPGNPDASQKMGEIASWLRARGLHVVVERAVAHTEFPNVRSWQSVFVYVCASVDAHVCLRVCLQVPPCVFDCMLQHVCVLSTHACMHVVYTCACAH